MGNAVKGHLWQHLAMRLMAMVWSLVGGLVLFLIGSAQPAICLQQRSRQEVCLLFCAPLCAHSLDNAEESTCCTLHSYVPTTWTLPTLDVS